MWQFLHGWKKIMQDFKFDDNKKCTEKKSQRSHKNKEKSIKRMVKLLRLYLLW